ncbi:MAG: APC family permease [Chloroflexi bacterium]|nr:APC family permease [Chloroflexota bacterium]
MTSFNRSASDPPGPASAGGTGHPDLEWRETVKGVKPGDRFVRIATHRGFRRVRPGYLVTRPGTGEPTTRLGRVFQALKRALIGSPIATEREIHERLSKTKALAVFSSDCLSSVAYAIEEIMRVLLLGGVALLSLTFPIALMIALLLTIVITSYRQTIAAYPRGGGSYIVASDNLGTLPGLTAAASLLVGYVLTVSVSIAAGTAATVSLVPELLPFSVPLSIGAVALVTLANLRGLRESGNIFAAPTYLFIVMVLGLIAFGLWRLAAGDLAYSPPESTLEPGAQALSLFLLLSAFSQGSTLLTGTEAISDGVPAFKPPEARNARITLTVMGVLVGTMFLGISFLAANLGVLPSEHETVVSQLGRAVFGVGPLWVVLQIATTLILILAANTAFADFPRLGSFLARDGFLPRAFQFRGDRLAFTAGIVSLAMLASLLLVVFQGSVEKLIPLYAVGVFTSFTFSQAGMVVRHRRDGRPGWQRTAMVNAVGSATTGAVTLIIATTRFLQGAWLVVVLLPLIISFFRAINSHYQSLARARQAETPLSEEEIVIRAVVPVADLGVEARQALAYARSIAPDDDHVVVVHVVDEPAAAERFQQQWAEWGVNADLVIIETPYRSLLGPLLSYLDGLRETHPRDTITVVLPEFVPSHWWEHLLHNQTALRLKAALLFHPGIVVASVPYHLAREAG